MEGSSVAVVGLATCADSSSVKRAMRVFAVNAAPAGDSTSHSQSIDNRQLICTCTCSGRLMIGYWPIQEYMQAFGKSVTKNLQCQQAADEADKRSQMQEQKYVTVSLVIKGLPF